MERKITAGGNAPLDLAELLSAVESHGSAGAAEWCDAIACYLAASEGWRDASPALGGAFANGQPEQELSGKKGP